MLKRNAVIVGILIIFAVMTSTGTSIAAARVEIDAKADSALKMSYEKVSSAKELLAKSIGIGGTGKLSQYN